MQELFQNLGINGKLLFAQIVNFLLILFLLKKFVFGKLISHLEARRKRIEKGLELRDSAEREMQRIEDARHRELQSARIQAEGVVAQARTDAEEKRKKALELVRQEAERLLAQARGEAEKQKSDATRAAAEDIRKISLLLAERVLARSLTKDDEQTALKEVQTYFEKEYQLQH
ncbi:MAG: ATP synthase F0 subunit B [Candidatus Wildermuthbacteria bacterium RIFCSPHIGHO2_12_FULL_45_9]|uniref:ATP synthase subunit b n=1 Tax=Candidatus Wildermuthbacteria bacterium RIFCSPHIGHO2_02_FULL_45_25 TaxID=1802450 RepID=A0A1G2QYE7_9BACT|nr:MAG: ATP synthase F0 subunit B [Candidatus Wildermuthbacteria bacterium RIFCSPHIGHO2_01_FULL_45_20]OHA65654.1 MAG: ATP synthase F0 subunit B [Candidatus Wildermuthbacteria bacterium RIFCSPHIGHO2_02_FULL_45_25]OHA70347.1 MAG: ATP synthase F0 subunit B [Candidatus Wildermuthbacteria bacterium RIFCSPHIGHO2_12_FULL_45_9]